MIQWWQKHHCFFFLLQHKGTPYCHNPCYGALYGPKILGFGVTSAANFRKSGDSSDSPDASFENDSTDGLKCIFKTTNTSPGPIKFLRNNSDDNTPPRVIQKRHSSGAIETQSDSSGYSSNSGSSTGLDVVSENSGLSSGLKCVYQSSGTSTSRPRKPTAPVARSHSDVGTFSTAGYKAPSKIRYVGRNSFEMFDRFIVHGQFCAVGQGFNHHCNSHFNKQK